VIFDSECVFEYDISGDSNRLPARENHQKFVHRKSVENAQGVFISLPTMPNQYDAKTQNIRKLTADDFSA
jgi:hypothetical protein